MTADIRTLVCSFLEREQVARIAAHPGVELLYRPDLLPQPRYPSDHHGPAPALDAEERAEWAALLRQADICFDFDWEEPAAMPARAPGVLWVQASSSGIGQFMGRTGLAGWDAVVTTAAGIHAQPLAEWAVMGVLYFVKDVPDLQSRQSAHRWERMAIGGLAGRRALVVGLGHVGRAVAAALNGLGVEVWGMRRAAGDRPIAGVSGMGSGAELLELLHSCDILVLTCPLTPETFRLIGAAEIAALGSDGILVNLARGAIIDEPALIDALRQRSIRGAVLDVVESEPLPANSPLWDFSNVLISPHSASTFAAENSALVDLFLRNLALFQTGEPLMNRYDPARGY
jgi:phosphoglycerate dehydrogenase-like enzyme